MNKKKKKAKAKELNFKTESELLASLIATITDEKLSNNIKIRQAKALIASHKLLGEPPAPKKSDLGLGKSFMIGAGIALVSKLLDRINIPEIPQSKSLGPIK